MRRLLFSVALLMQGCLAGCSAQHWVGESANNPGVEAHGGNFWTPAGFSVTGNTNASVESLAYTGHTDTMPSSMTVTGLTFGQDVSSVIKEQPAKIAAITEAQRVQVEYAAAVGQMVTTVVHDLTPFFNLLAAAGINSTSSGMSMTLPNGFSIGKTKINNPVDLSNYIRATLGQLQNVPTNTPISTLATVEVPLSQLKELQAFWDANHPAVVRPTP